MNDLEPCSYCKDDNVLVCVYISEYGTSHYLQCRKCGLRTSSYISNEAAVKAWNEGKVGGFYKPVKKKKED